MELKATGMEKGKALMERGSWSTAHPQSRVGTLRGLLPANVSFSGLGSKLRSWTEGSH